MENEVEARKIVTRWHLGQTSQRYESSGSGAAAISNGTNDHGGASYGAYQLSSKTGTLQEYLSQSVYGAQFEGLVPATVKFNDKWRELATVDPGFGKDQHIFIGTSHYQVQKARLEKAGLNLTDRGIAIQDMVWSTSVQFRDLTPTIISGGIREKYGNVALSDLTDCQIVEAVQDYKSNHIDSLFRSSPGLWPGLSKRANSEKTALLNLAVSEELVRTESPNLPLASQAETGTPQTIPSVISRGRTPITTVLNIAELQGHLNNLGYRDATLRQLQLDGVFGDNTHHAIRAFQQAHHLHPDGIVGKHTLAALKHARQSPLLSEATHPQHRLYVQALHGIHALPGKTFGTAREQHNAAATLTIASHAAGLHRIDHVVLGTDAVRLFAVEGRMDDPAHRRVHVDRALAVAQTVEQGTRAMERAAMQEPAHSHAAFVAMQEQVDHRGVTVGVRP